MKNKKLFAILTLVCFMFTLMPVAAFAAPIDGKVMAAVYDEETLNYGTAKNSVTAKNEEIVKLTVAGVEATTEWYYIAVDADGNVVDLGISQFDSDDNTAAAIRFVAGEVFDVAGTYKIYAVKADAKGVSDVVNAPLMGAQEKANLLLGATYKDARVAKAATITVKYVADSYKLAVYPVISEDGDLGDEKVTSIDLDANGSYGAESYGVVLTTAAGNEVAGATVKISHNGVNVAKSTVTNEDGVGYFKVYGNVVGNFKVEVSYADVEVKIPVTVGSVDPVDVNVVAEPKAPVDVNEASTAFGIGFELVDGNGNVLTNDADLMDGTNKLYKLSVAGPAASTVKVSDLSLKWDSYNEYFEIAGIDADSELAEGKYTFTVALESGKSAKASVEVKEFDKPVALTMLYGLETVDTVAGIGDVVTLKTLKYVDAAGVTKDAKEDIGYDVQLSVSGKAVASFNENDGTLVIREADKYVGETITVVAVYDETLVATANVKVVDEAVVLQYKEEKVEAGRNNTLVFDVVDQNGEVIALNKAIETVTSEDGKETTAPKATSATVTVVKKPADAYVAASVLNPTNVDDQVKVSFTPSTAGEYEVMVVVTYTDVNELGKEVTRSVTGTAVINVGDLNNFKDIVVMSIGANKIVVNNDVEVIDCAPVVENNRTFVPFRALIQAFGAEVAYDEATQAVTATLGDVTVVMTIGSAEYTVNGEVKTADVAPFIKDSRTMVPVRFVAEAFGINVTPVYGENGATVDVLFAK